MPTRGNFSPIIKERVVNALYEKGKKQKDMANDLGFSPEHLSRCLSKGEISKTWLISIADYLNCSPEWLSNEDATDLSSFGYQRKETLKNEDEIMESLFLLLGWQPVDYTALPEKERKNLKTDIDLIIAAYTGRNPTMNQITLKIKEADTQKKG